jgi:hypothetical protein
MAVVGFVAVCLAAIAFEVNGQYGYLIALSYGISLAGMGVLLYNVRLSGWLWIAIAGYAGPFLLGMLGHVVSLGIASTLLFVLGLAMTFRDVRRKLESRETPT